MPKSPKTNNLFFYHDNTYRRNWLGKKINHPSQKTTFGSFTKRKYPFDFQSALTFVDHCDFDSVSKVEAIFYGTSDKNSKSYGKKGIVGTGLTATKTVFVNAAGSENIGLENNNYLKLIEKLFKDGVEIAPHSLLPKKSLLRGSAALKKNLQVMAKFKPRTWVDHAYLCHNITRQGWNKKSPYYLLDRLLQKGYLFFWSKIDYSLNAPDGNLNLLDSSGRAGKYYLAKVLKLIKQRQKISKITFVFFWDFVGNLLGWQAKDDLMLTINTIHYFFKNSKNKRSQKLFEPTFGPVKRTIKRLLNPSFYFQIGKNFFFPGKATSLTESFYSVELEKGKAFYLFTSLWINDCVDCYTPQNIERLIENGGLHIGHNYFCVEERHYLNPTFKKVGRHYHIADGFQRNLEYLAQRQKDKKVWVTTIAEFGRFFLGWQKVVIKLISPNKLLIKNFSSDKIKGLTISKKIFGSKNPRVQFSVAKDWDFIRRKGEFVIWFGLKPNEELTLEIG